MKRFVRPVLSVVLSAVLALTSLSAAAARGQDTVFGTMVICRGMTVVTVFVDADGEPVEQVHICPDAALSFVAGPDGDVVFPELDVSWQRQTWATPFFKVVEVVSGASDARAPPLQAS